mmetsp:Transcript_33566/g.33826  ORF Transcript_33566/g.33826 Transcript_33566/m.33826 type:complete len:170 (+) Transcript_33566:1173-1682(+)
MEADPRRRVSPPTEPPHAVLRFCWFWMSDLHCFFRSYLLLRRWFFESGEAWIIDDVDPGVLHVVRSVCGLHVLPVLQMFPWTAVAAVHPLYGSNVPRALFLYLHFLQHCSRILPQLGFGALSGRAATGVHVVRYFHSACLFRGVFRIQAAGIYLSHGYEHDCACDSRTH